MELNSKNIKKILLIITLGALIFTGVQNISLVFTGINKVFSVFSPVIVALCIAFVLNVLLTALETKVFKFWDKAKKPAVLKFKRPVCLLLTYLLAFGILSLLILVIIPDIIDTVKYLSEKMPIFAGKFRGFLTTFLSAFNVSDSEIPDIKIDWSAAANSVTNWISGSSGKFVDSALGITTSFFSGVFDAIFSLVISIYVLAQKERIGAFVKRTFNAFLPSKTTGFIYHVSEKTYDLFSRFIGGQLLEAVILGSLCCLGMLILGLPNAVIISVVISFTALVPIVGATIGLVVGFLLIVITSPVEAIIFVVFLLILQQLEGNLIYPKVVGKAVGLPGVLVVSAVMVGGNLGGIVGTLIAVPTMAVLYTLLKEFVDFTTEKNTKKVAVAVTETDDDSSSCDTEYDVTKTEENETIPDSQE